jgi:peptidoglycan/xylan/chitin deacetylase (PgdA/CDA1 family)
MRRLDNTGHARIRDLAALSELSATFALPRSESIGQSTYARLGDKLSRLLARKLVTKRLAMRNARPMVSFTFDDAPVSAADGGARLLEQYQARGTYYISGGGCGAMSPGGTLAAAGQVQALHARGHEIGCHTYSHAAVSDVDDDALTSELERNRSFLEAIDARIAVRNFAYPYGDLSFPAKRRLETYFDSCRSLRPGVNAGVADLGALKSCELQNSSIDRQGILDIIAETVRRNGWLVFTCHDVAPEPSRFGVSPDLLAFALETARAAGCQIAPVREALRAVSG